jgi:hypothetical protein
MLKCTAAAFALKAMHVLSSSAMDVVLLLAVVLGALGPRTIDRFRDTNIPVELDG